MKIAVYHNLPSGGAKRALYEMARHLAARRHELWEFAPTTATHDFLPLDDFCIDKVSFSLHIALPVRRWMPLLTPYANLGIMVANLARSESLARIAAKTIDNGGFDLVFCHDCQVTGVPNILRHLRTPAVFYCHHGAGIHLRLEDDGQLSAKNQTKSLREQVKQSYYAPAEMLASHVQRAVARKNCWTATENWTNSSFSRERMLYYYGVDSSVVSLGVNISTFHSLPTPRQRFLLSVGSLHPCKGYDFLVRALGKIPACRRPVLIIAANSIDPGYQHRLSRLAEEQDVQWKAVQVFDDTRLALLYNQAAFLVYTPVMEAFGLAALESMACGTPVVAVKEGGIRESVVDGVTGVLVDRDEGIFAETIDRLSQDVETCKRMGEAGIEHVRRSWTWEQTASKIERRFAEVIRR